MLLYQIEIKNNNLDNSVIWEVRFTGNSSNKNDAAIAQVHDIIQKLGQSLKDLANVAPA